MTAITFLKRSCAELKRLQLRQLVLDPFQRCRNSPGLGLAIGQCHQVIRLNLCHRTDGAEHELPVGEFALCIDVQAHRHRIGCDPRLQLTGFDQSR